MPLMNLRASVKSTSRRDCGSEVYWGGTKGVFWKGRREGEEAVQARITPRGSVLKELRVDSLLISGWIEKGRREGDVPRKENKGEEKPCGNREEGRTRKYRLKCSIARGSAHWSETQTPERLNERGKVKSTEGNILKMA